MHRAHAQRPQRAQRSSVARRLGCEFQLSNRVFVPDGAPRAQLGQCGHPLKLAHGVRGRRVPIHAAATVTSAQAPCGTCLQYPIAIAHAGVVQLVK